MITKKQRKSSRKRVQSKKTMKRYFNNISTMHFSNRVEAKPVMKSSGYAASLKKSGGRGE